MFLLFLVTANNANGSAASLHKLNESVIIYEPVKRVFLARYGRSLCSIFWMYDIQNSRRICRSWECRLAQGIWDNLQDEQARNFPNSFLPTFFHIACKNHQHRKK
jgi:hypothetical protein